MKTIIRLLGSFVVPILVCMIGNVVALLIASVFEFFSTSLGGSIYFGNCIGIGVLATGCAKEIAPFGGKIISGIFAISYCALAIYAMTQGWNDYEKVDILNMIGISLGCIGSYVAILRS